MASNKHPSKLFVEVTTCCNLQCGMCVKQNGMGGIPEGIMSTETFKVPPPRESLGRVPVERHGALRRSGRIAR